MSISSLRADTMALLAQAKERVHDAEVQLKRGGDLERVRAAGQLILLRRQQRRLEARIEELQRYAGRRGGGYAQAVQEGWLIFVQQIERWIGGA